jgi:hypothetical protein
VEEKRRVYVSSHFKREKRFIAETIVVAIKSLDPPGRFLSRDSKTGVWFPINDDRAREKASQALRENSRTIKAELQQSDDSIRKQGELLLPEKRVDSPPDFNGRPTSQEQSRKAGNPDSAYCAGDKGGQNGATFVPQHHPYHYSYPPAPGWTYPYHYGYQAPPFPNVYHLYAYPPPPMPVGGAAACYAYHYTPPPDTSAPTMFHSTATLPTVAATCYPAPVEPGLHDQQGSQRFQSVPEQQQPLPPDNEPHAIEDDTQRQDFVHRSDLQRRVLQDFDRGTYKPATCRLPKRSSPHPSSPYPLSPRSPESSNYGNPCRNPRGFLGAGLNTANQDPPHNQQHSETWPKTPVAAFQDILLQACQDDPSFGSSAMPDRLHHNFTPFPTSSPKAPSTAPFNYSRTPATTDAGESPAASESPTGLWWDTAQSSTPSPGNDRAFRQYPPDHGEARDPSSTTSSR